MDRREIRWLNFQYLVEGKPSRKEYAEALGYPNTNYINQLLSNHCGIGNKTAKRIEEVEGLPDGWLSQQHPDLWQGGLGQQAPNLSYWAISKLKTPQILKGIEVMTKVIREREAEYAVGEKGKKQSD